MPKNVFAYFRIEDNKKSYRLTREFKFILGLCLTVAAYHAFKNVKFFFRCLLIHTLGK